MPRTRPVVGAAVLALLLLVTGVTPARAADVHGDDERDRYVGSGGLILPGSTDASTRREVAGCPDCLWRMTSPCVASVLGNAFGSGCTSVMRGCPGGELLRTWFRGAGQAWREVGLVCVGPDGPLTVDQAGAAVVQRVTQGIPALTPTFAPAHGVLAQLPVRFRAGESGGERRFAMVIVGREVSIVARPNWQWSFGDGSRVVDDTGAVAHVYRRSRQYEVRCSSTWSARFTVDGLGPFDVPEPIRQEAALGVPVGEGRALLVPG